METIILDFTGCKYLEEIHQILKGQFDFPDYYGKNLDALWDCMRYYCDYPLHVTIKGLNTLPKEFDEYMQKILGIFNRVNTDSPNITFEIVA